MAPQVLQVLLCVNCKAFQVHIVKKAKKWECKLCGTKQTQLQTYGTGTGPECRLIVQKLNEARGVLEQTYASIINTSVSCNSIEGVVSTGTAPGSPEDQETTPSSQIKTGESKWGVYLDDDTAEASNNRHLY